MTAVPAALRAFTPPPALVGILRTLQGRGFEAWVVGGALRDLLLGLGPGEFDLASSATPAEVAAAFPRVVETGLDHGTVTVVADGMAVEVTTFRAQEPSIEADLMLRDFTINAMAYDPLAGCFLDPAGGRADLEARLVRAVGSPRARFADDPLRPMRACRFASRFAFRIERETRRAIPAFVDAFGKVAKERVQVELAKLLTGPHPRYGLELLRRTGLLAVFLPELLEGLGLRQNRWHRYDVYHHVLRAVQAARPTLPVRLAVLLHDIDKPRTAAPSPRHEGENTFYGHEVSGAARARAICERLRFGQKLCARVELLVREHQFVYTEAWSDAAVRRMLARVGPAFDELLAVREADVRGHGRNVEEGLENLRALERRARRLLEQRPALRTSDLALGGREVMAALGIGPSPRVGEALRFLLGKVLEDPERNTKETLLGLLQAWSEEPGGGESR